MNKSVIASPTLGISAVALNPGYIRVSPDPVLPQCVRPAYQTPTVCQIQLDQNLTHPLLPPALLPSPLAYAS